MKAGIRSSNAVSSQISARRFITIIRISARHQNITIIQIYGQSLDYEDAKIIHNHSPGERHPSKATGTPRSYQTLNKTGQGP
ncbi:hypothetical protein DPMN_100660 [Dreissena polymorpha]|uniref:Uncharacterized protein n=1 Tax=Dreissena polymorpha TaxID=45954 RepID=A0A9D4LJN2_DREPO|nr:hypothetical protein DPMN_100660 [Dreissena polymorpha]